MTTSCPRLYGFGCAGGNLSPQFSWSGAPEGTKSFALTCFDPDAPTGSGFWHWVVVNIPADATSLALGAGSADGADAGPARSRPAPTSARRATAARARPEGDHPHRYLFTPARGWAFDSLPVEADTSAAVVGFMLNFNTLAKASLMGLCKR